MKRYCVGLLWITAVFFSMFESVASAQPLGGGHGQGQGMGRGMGQGPGWAMQQLDLSAEQQKELACDAPGQGRELKEAYFQERKSLNEMIRNRTVSDSEIYLQLDRVNQKFAEWNTFRLQKMLKARNVLTDAQLQKLTELQGDVDRGLGH